MSGDALGLGFGRVPGQSSLSTQRPLSSNSLRKMPQEEVDPRNPRIPRSSWMFRQWLAYWVWILGRLGWGQETESEEAQVVICKI